MNVWYWIAVPGWMLVMITAATRLHDLGRLDWEVRHHIRRIGLIGIGAIAFVMVMTPWTEDRWFYAPATWRSAAIAWSWSVVWLTTEGLPPWWWDYFYGIHRKTATWRNATLREKIGIEWRAVKDIFKPRRRRHPLPGPQGPLP